MTLGNNWSGRATVKAGHELIVSGPYSLARHPIYTGLLLASIGTALATAEWRCILGLALIVSGFAAKIGQEEKLMMQTFPDAYPRYRQRVKALIPGVAVRAWRGHSMANHEGSNADADLGAQAEQMEQDLGGIRQALRSPLDAEVARGELTAPQTAVMREVVRSEGISLRDLSRAVSLAHSTVSGIVDRLEKRGLIERRPDPEDGRVSCIYPTTPVRRICAGTHSDAQPRTAAGRAQHAQARKNETTIGAALRRLRELLESDELDDSAMVASHHAAWVAYPRQF